MRTSEFEKNGKKQNGATSLKGKKKAAESPFQNFGGKTRLARLGESAGRIQKPNEKWTLRKIKMSQQKGKASAIEKKTWTRSSL